MNLSDVDPSESPLVVFVSSAISGMQRERQVVREASCFPDLTRPWLFEYTSASALPLEASYLSKVEQCDLFVLLLDGRASEAVRLEYSTALQCKKPVLVFVRRRDGSPR